MADHPFAKDLGYLFPFFERVEAYAGELPEAQAARLRALLEGTPARWREIAALLDGAEPSAEAPTHTTPSTGEAAEEADPAPTPKAAAEDRWTVGPLLRS